MFDEDGYPTEGFLNKIRTWHFTRGFYELMEFAMSGHIYKDYFTCYTNEDGKKVVWEVSTGGWSGNEDIIEALNENTLFWAMCWVQSRRGGHFIFETPQKLNNVEK